MRNYEAPDLKVIYFEAEDILTSSDTTVDPWGNGSDNTEDPWGNLQSYSFHFFRSIRKKEQQGCCTYDRNIKGVAALFIMVLEIVRYFIAN